MNEIQQQVKTIVEEAVPGISVDYEKDADRPLKDLGIDSLDKMTILLEVQERWSREFKTDEINAMNTLSAICESIASEAAP
jgi:acyl carrier protein